MRPAVLAPALALVPAVLFNWSEGTRTAPTPAVTPAAQLAFEPAAGRFGDDVSFIARGERMTLFIGDRGSTLVVGGKKRAVVRTTLVGARRATPAGAARSPGIVNSYVGPRSSWRTRLPTFGRVASAGVYPGIDLAYHGTNGRLEYDFHVAPGADPGRIAMQITGGRDIRLDHDGNLLVGTRAGQLRELKPVALQGRRRIDARFRVAGRRVSFELGPYDRTAPLVIDPTLAYASYLGGSGDDEASGVTVDGSGNAYIALTTGSTDFPGAGSASGFNAALTKVAPDGKTRVYSTYFGGSGTDNSYGVAIDGQGDAFIAGYTESADLPGRSTGQQSSLSGPGDGYVAKFDPTGALIRSTYLGGTSYDHIFGIAIDSSGDLYVTGEELSTDFPTGPGTPMQAAKGSNDSQSDAFVTKLASSLQDRLYSTYLGGMSGDYGNGIAVGPDGSAWTTGLTTSSDFPLTNPADPEIWYSASDPPPLPLPAEAFVTKLSPDGSTRTYSTYLGGNSFDQGNAIAVDSSGNAYVAGDAQSSYADRFYGGVGNQDDNAGGVDALIAKFTSDGQLLYIGWYGGSGNDSGQAVGFDPQGNGYFAGRTSSVNLRTTSGVPQPQNANGATLDGWVMKMSSATQELAYATYIGGGSFDGVADMTVDGHGSAYLVGDTQSNDFPVTSAPMQVDTGGPPDAWFAKLAITPATVDSGPDGALRSRDASFTYSTGEPNSTFKCRLAPIEASFATCPRSGKSYSGLADGDYTFELGVTDSGGTTSDPVRRRFSVDTRPIADFAIAPNPALAGRTVTFDGSVSAGAGIALTKFEWDLDGNGSFERDTGASSSTTNVYPSALNLPISLRVTDAEGKTATITKDLHVTTPPKSTQFGVTINKGARWTNTPDVIVTANFPASTTSLLFSNDGGFLDPAEFVPKPTIKWRLDSSGPERLPKTIYVRFLAGAFVSETHQDDIILDETPPKVQDAVVSPAGSATSVRAAKLRSWKVKVKATDKNSGVGRIQVTANKKKPGKLIRYKRRLIVKSATRPRWVRARDRAGNFSRWRRARG